jgi:hypothetical protein
VRSAPTRFRFYQSPSAVPDLRAPAQACDIVLGGTPLGNASKHLPSKTAKPGPERPIPRRSMTLPSREP